MSIEVWAFSEKINVTKELLSKASEVAAMINGKPAAVVLGENVSGAEELFEWGAEKIYVVEHENLRGLIPESWADALAKLIDKLNPKAVIIGSTKNGREIAARVATKIGAGCATECTDLTYDKDRDAFMVKKPVYAARAVATEIIKTKTAIITIPPKIFEAVRRGKSEGELVKVEIEVRKPRISVIEVKEKEIRGVPLEEAEVLVVGGRGFKSKEDFKMLEKLASLLNGQVSCSRPIAADLKWLPDWVGLSGHKVKPKLYIGVGVSGAVQHLAGIQGAKIIVAINKDPEAPIFSAADYGIVGDLYEVLPKLIEALEQAKFHS